MTYFAKLSFSETIVLEANTDQQFRNFWISDMIEPICQTHANPFKINVDSTATPENHEITPHHPHVGDKKMNTHGQFMPLQASHSERAPNGGFSHFIKILKNS